MARTFSPAMISAVTRVEGERPVVLATIRHTQLTEPVRIGNIDDGIDSRGDRFVGLPFNVTLPSAERDTPPRARLSVDNVGTVLMEWLELSQGGTGASVTLEVVMFDTPDVVEWTCTMRLRNVVADAFQVSADLSFEDVVNSRFTSLRFDTATTPGLF